MMSKRSRVYWVSGVIAVLICLTVYSNFSPKTCELDDVEIEEIAKHCLLRHCSMELHSSASGSIENYSYFVECSKALTLMRTQLIEGKYGIQKDYVYRCAVDGLTSEIKVYSLQGETSRKSCYFSRKYTFLTGVFDVPGSALPNNDYTFDSPDGAPITPSQIIRDDLL